MSAEPIIAALALPPETRVEQRVPKKLLLENGAPTAGDKRKIQDGIEELLWVAALKPVNIGVPPYRDDEREYLEVAVLVLTLRPAAKGPRLAELIHRAIPYPVFLVATLGATASVSVAHKRWSQAEQERMVVDAVVTSTPFSPTAPAQDEAAFLASLAVAQLPRRDLFALYQGWHDRLAALDAAQIKGSFVPPGSGERALANEANLRNLERGWLVFGVNNSTRRVVGSDYRLDLQRLHGLKHQIAQGTEPSITFREIHEFPHADGRVVLFEIPAAPLGIPVAWNTHYKLLLSKLPEVLTPAQKANKIRNLLTKLRLKNVMGNRGTRSHPAWALLNVSNLAKPALGLAKKTYGHKI